MDSEEDMMDANDVDSVDDDFYSGHMEDDYYSDSNGDYDHYDDDEDDDGPDYDFMAEAADDPDDSALARSQQNFTILGEADIRQRQEADITGVSDVLSISRYDACILLHCYNWSVGKVHDEWFADEEAVRASVGLLKKPVFQFSNARELTCGICFESFPWDKIISAACGHPFCKSCWSGPGPAALTSKAGNCPDTWADTLKIVSKSSG